MKTTALITRLFSGVLLLSSAPALGFVFNYGETYTPTESLLVFYVDIPGVSDSGVSWNEAFDIAVAGWNTRIPSPISVVREYRAPCDNNENSAAVFAENVCGVSVSGRGGVATALVFTGQTEESVIGAKAILGFDPSLQWNVYDGPSENQVIEGSQVIPIDFRRVAAHELGHALGLGHSMFRSSILTEVPKVTESITGPSIDDFCGIAVLNGQPEACEILLPGTASLDGENSEALFFGGASTDKGLTYTDEVLTSETLDVMATVVVAPEDVEKPGKLYVVALLEDGSLFAQDSSGGFSLIEEGQGLPAVESKVLDGANELYIINDLNLENAGAGSGQISIFLGYSIDEEPNNIIYSTTPIQFMVGEF